MTICISWPFRVPRISCGENAFPTIHITHIMADFLTIKEENRKEKEKVSRHISEHNILIGCVCRWSCAWCLDSEPSLFRWGSCCLRTPQRRLGLRQVSGSYCAIHRKLRSPSNSAQEHGCRDSADQADDSTEPYERMHR